MHIRMLARIFFAAGVIGILPAGARADCENRIDVQHSTMKIHVGKSGLFSAFGHDHEIEAPIAEGTVKTCENRAVELRVNAQDLRVLDPGEKEQNRAEIQKTMLGSQVLDSHSYPEIRFVSSEVQAAGAGRWIVHGQLTLHGQTHALKLEVTEAGGRYRGSAMVSQREFGITPVSIAGGTVKVKNEVKIEFEIALASKTDSKGRLHGGKFLYVATRRAQSGDYCQVNSGQPASVSAPITD